jgi:chaperonin GroES
MKLRPLGKKVVVKVDEIPDVTKGGIHLPDCARQTEQGRGRVISLPDDSCSVGGLCLDDTVVFQKYAGVEVVDEDTKEKFRILKLKEVLAVVE